MRAGRRHSYRSPARGYTFVSVLVLLAVCMIGLSIAGPNWAEAARRGREHELLRIGRLYALALAEYQATSPGALKAYPSALDELVDDHRFVGVRRHLRRLYPDPLAPDRAWGLVRDAQERIIGVYSQSDAAPVAQGALDLGGVRLPAARHYSDWHFIAPVSDAASAASSRIR
jgi:type II secretory pathway pseudopilin PulG